MRILVAHNFYRSDAPSGENKIVRAEVDLLRDGGVEVVELFTDSDRIPSGVRGMVQAAPGPVYAREGVRRFTGLLDEHRPDVVHVHNVFPLISPYVVRVAARRGVPVVQTVHNYRHSCVNGLHLRDGHTCTDCLGSRLGLPGVQHGCYRGSRAQTVPMTIGQVVHRRTWRDGVARYLALTPFMRDTLTASGISADRITIRPTWVPDPGDAGAARPRRPVRRSPRRGEGHRPTPRRLAARWPRLRALAGGRGRRPAGTTRGAGRDRDPSVSWRGRLEPAGVADAMRDAAYVVVPSRFFEGYPLVVAEAFARGRAVLTVVRRQCRHHRGRLHGVGGRPDGVRAGVCPGHDRGR